MPDEDRRAVFLDAVKRNDVSAAERCLAAQPDLVQLYDRDCFGCRPLTHAASHGHREMVDLLLDRGADIDGKSDWWAGGFGALPCDDEALAEHLVSRGATVDAYIAAGMGWAERLRDILAAHPDQVNMKGGDGQRPLHQAKTAEVVDLLVAAGADLEARDVDHHSTPIQYRIQHREVVERLLQHGARPDIFTACRWGDRTVAERVLADQPDALDQTIGRPPFIAEAPAGGHIYTFLLRSTTRPLTLAAKHDHWPLLERLLPRATPGQQLIYACWVGDLTMIDRLRRQHRKLAAKLPPHQQGAIADAAWEHRTEAVARMLAAGWPVDAAGVHDSTPLDRACFHGFADLVELLLERGASVTVRNEFGGDPLGCCCHGATRSWRDDGDHAACVKLLLAHGAKAREELLPTGSEAVDAVLREALG